MKSARSIILRYGGGALFAGDILKQRLIKQYNEVDCGIACMQMILSNYSSWVSTEYLRDITDTDSEGTSAYGIVNGFEKLNINCDVYTTEKNIWINQNRGFDFPIIANVIIDNKYLHYCIVYGKKKNKLLIADPAIGKYKISIEKFNKLWTGVILVPSIGEKFQPINYRKKELANFTSFIKSQCKRIFAITIVSTIITTIGILSSYYFKILIDIVLPSNNLSLLYVMSISYIAGGVITSTFEVLRRYGLEIMGQNIGRNILLSYLDHVFKLPATFFYKRKTGDIVSRFSDASKIIEALANFTISLVLDMVSVTAVGLMLYHINNHLFFITILSIPLYVVIVLGSNKKMTKLNEKEMQNNAMLDSNFIEGLKGIDTIKAFRTEKYIIRNIFNSLNDTFQVSIRRSLFESLIQNLKSFISILTSSLVLWAGSYYVINGSMTVGELITFNSLSMFFSSPIQRIINLQEQFQKAKVANKRLNDILSIEPEESEDRMYSKNLNDITLIRFKNVYFSYSCNYPYVLKDLNFSIPLKKNIGIIGDSGSGKSTLAKLLVGFLEPDEGQIYIDNHDITHISNDRLRSMITYVPQESFILSGTIKENLFFGLNTIPNEKELEEVLKNVYLWEFIKNLPLGLDTYLEENGANLSGGQKQRIALARSILSKSKILLLDEATSALDKNTEQAIFEKLLRLPNKSIIAISHNTKLISNFDCIIDLNKNL